MNLKTTVGTTGYTEIEFALGVNFSYFESLKDFMKRALIFIVAYKAESTIETLLRRIPKEIPEVAFEVLIIDDASEDRTFELGKKISESGELPFPITVLKNPKNQRYGGNQKIGYLYAIENQFEIVVLLHGDGQYSPELIPLLIKPLLEGRADAVFGSRMLTPFGALKGGMPLYKYLGNKVLTRFENWILGTDLSEFHSGYRFYSVAALKQIPFQYNTNDFHFDTEIIIQLVLAKLRICEIAIPTFYGEEICRVNGIKYAFDIIGTTVLAWLQRYQIFYRRNYDIEWRSNEPLNVDYAAKLHYASSHSYALEAVPVGSRVIQIGRGPAAFQEALRAKGCRLLGGDRDGVRAASLPQQIRGNDFEENPIPEPLEQGDVVLILDVIEHLNSPENFLKIIYETTEANQSIKFVLTTGNVAFILVRLMLLMGQFNYGKRGILDMTHTRLFTFSSIRRLLEQYGYEITQERGIPVPFPAALGQNRLSRILLKLNQWAIGVSKGIFSYQIYVEFKATPSLNFLLKSTIKR